MTSFAHTPRRGLALKTLAAIACFLALAFSAFAAESAKRSYDLPAGDAEKTLKLFTQQSGEQIIYSPTKVAGIQTNAVSGTMTPGEVLFALLDKTQLIAVQDGRTGGYTIQRAATVEQAEKNGESRRASSPVATGRGVDSSTMDETVQLSPFTVSSSQTARYQASDSISGGRIRTSLMDSDASIQVITRDLIEDIGSTVILDAAKYAAGVSESNAPNALDRITVRGFQTDGQTVDGFYFLGAANFDPALVDRLEIVKGPNAVLSPTGTPGGTVNIVTKKPAFKPAAYMSVQTGLYDANRIEFDQTAPLKDLPLAYRLVAAAQDSTGPFHNFYRKSIVLAPSVTWRPFARTEITAQGEYYNWQSLTYSGLPLDPSVGTSDRARLWDGVPEDFGLYQPDEHRMERKYVGTLQATTTIGKHLSVRLAGRGLTATVTNLQINTGLNVPGGSYNPYTGLWDGGKIWGGTFPNFTSSVAPTPSRTVIRAGTWQVQNLSRLDLQNDYIFNYRLPFAETVTSAGYQNSYQRQAVAQQNVSRGTQNLDNPGPVAQLVYAPINQLSRVFRSFHQYYFTERLMFWERRFIISVGAAPLHTSGLNFNKLLGTKTNAPRDYTTHNHGVVLKPLPNVALFYANSGSALPNTDFGAVSAGSAPPFSVGKQKEGGVRAQFLEGKVTGTFSYFDIVQDGYSIPNPANLAVPPPTVPFPGVYTTRTAKGWEFNLNAAVSKQLSIIANVTKYKNRDPNNVPFRSTAEESAAMLVRYDLSRLLLPGFAVSIGADYMGKRPGDAASGYARASTPTAVIPNQPSFYLPARTVTNLYLSYDRKGVTYRLIVDNLFDVDYLRTALNRQSVWPGFPLNVRAGATYRY